jgi:DNA-binding CsgD family transcriptional regulator
MFAMLFFRFCTGSRYNLRRMLLIVVSGLCCTLNARGQYQDLLHKTFAERAVALNKFYMHDLVNLDSVTLFTRINAIKKLATDNNDDDLLMEAALLRAHYFYYRWKFPRTLVMSMLDSLNQEAKKQGRLWLQIMTENMEGLYSFEKMQHYEQGFEHQQRVYDMLKEVSPDEFPYKEICLSQMADKHYFFNDFRTSIFYNLQAIKAKIPVQLAPFPVDLTILNTIGLCYQELKMNDSAEYYFRQTISLAKVMKDEAWDGIGSGNLGYNLFLEKKYAAAVPLLERDVTLAVKGSDWGLASGSLIVLANISLLDGNLVKAGEQVALCRQYVSLSGQYQRFQRLYPLMSKYYALTNHPALAAEYLDSSTFVKDSLNRKFSALQLMRANQKIDLERNRAEIANIESQKTISILERDGLLAILILVMGATILVYREQRKRVRLQKELVIKAQSELEDATHQLNDFAKNISEKNEMIELLGLQSDGSEKEAVWKLQQSTILTDADWAYFKGLFEKVHNGYLQRLKDKLPGLTPAEIRFMALSKLGLSSREMAAMLGVGTDAIRQYRSRLRKKFDLQEEASLEEFAAQI